jgi:hypothetical protein
MFPAAIKPAPASSNDFMLHSQDACEKDAVTPDNSASTACVPAPRYTVGT